MNIPKFYEGDINILNDVSPKLAIVGSRLILDCTKNYLEDLFHELSNFDITIVSGGMYGVDIFAHNLALKNNMKTIVVLPQGISIFKKSILFRQLKIDKNSKILLTSEYEPDFKPRKYTFIERNKIIAKYSQVTLVAQASIKSGSISTALNALKLSKKVIAIPLSIDVTRFQGTNFLISNGAQIYLSPKTVLENYNLTANSIEDRIIGLIDKSTKINFDDLVEKVETNSSIVQKTLLKLILEGRVFYDGGEYFL